LAAHFDVDVVDPVAAAHRPNTNTAPGSAVLVIRNDGGERHLESLRWGLVPSWAKDPAIGNRMINARSETAAVKPSFRRAVVSRRCIVPVDGFYEWFRPEGRRTKQPYLVHRSDEGPYAVAGLWERWRPPGHGADADRPVPDDVPDPTSELRTVTLLTTEANPVMSTIHDRMPVLLDPSDWDEWLGPDRLADGRLEALCQPAPDGWCTLRAVSSRVNDARHRGEDLLEPVQPLEGAPPSTDGSTPGAGP